MAVFNNIRAPHGPTPVDPSGRVGTPDHIPTASSRLTSHWSPGPDGRQVWRWSIADAAHP